MGELLALQWRDVDFPGDAIRVRRSYNIHGGVGTPKSGKGPVGSDGSRRRTGARSAQRARGVHRRR
jgi:hypothetical protein